MTRGRALLLVFSTITACATGYGVAVAISHSGGPAGAIRPQQLSDCVASSATLRITPKRVHVGEPIFIDAVGNSGHDLIDVSTTRLERLEKHRWVAQWPLPTATSSILGVGPWGPESKWGPIPDVPDGQYRVFETAKALGSNHTFGLCGYITIVGNASILSNGAIPATEAIGASTCQAKRLSTKYWISEPAISTELSGITVTNDGISTCLLPKEVSSLVVVNKRLEAVAASSYRTPSRLPTATDSTGGSYPVPSLPAPEFANADLDNPPTPLSVLHVKIERWALRPGGRAVLIISIPTMIGVRGTALPTSCIAPPAGGGLTMSLGGSPILTEVPNIPSPISPPSYPTHEAFVECSTSVVYPFVTWRQAMAIVGPQPNFGTGVATPSTTDSKILAVAP